MRNAKDFVYDELLHGEGLIGWNPAGRNDAKLLYEPSAPDKRTFQFNVNVNKQYVGACEVFCADDGRLMFLNLGFWAQNEDARTFLTLLAPDDGAKLLTEELMRRGVITRWPSNLVGLNLDIMDSGVDSMTIQARGGAAGNDSGPGAGGEIIIKLKGGAAK